MSRSGYYALFYNYGIAVGTALAFGEPVLCARCFPALDYYFRMSLCRYNSLFFDVIALSAVLPVRLAVLRAGCIFTLLFY